MRKRRKRRRIRRERSGTIPGTTHTAILGDRPPAPAGTTRVVAVKAADQGVPILLHPRAVRPPGFGMPPSSPATINNTVATTQPTTKEAEAGRALVAGKPATSGGTVPTAKKIALAKGKTITFILYHHVTKIAKPPFILRTWYPGISSCNVWYIKISTRLDNFEATDFLFA